MGKGIILIALIGLVVLVSASDIQMPSERESSKIINLQPIIKTIKDFLDLDDTPSSYTGQGGLCVAVNPGEDSLIFQNCTNATLDGIVDTNATTECADGEYLDGGGWCASINSTIDTRVPDIWVNESGDTMTGDLKIESSSGASGLWLTNLDDVLGSPYIVMANDSGWGFMIYKNVKTESTQNTLVFEDLNDHTKFFVYDAEFGRLGINDKTPSYTLDVDGSISSQTDSYCNSTSCYSLENFLNSSGVGTGEKDTNASTECDGDQVLLGNHSCMNSSLLGSGNASWNQSLADTLYATIGSGNASWNESHADNSYAKYQFEDNNFNGSGDFTTTGKVGIKGGILNFTDSGYGTGLIQFYDVGDHFGGEFYGEAGKLIFASQAVEFYDEAYNNRLYFDTANEHWYTDSNKMGIGADLKVWYGLNVSDGNLDVDKGNITAFGVICDSVGCIGDVVDTQKTTDGIYVYNNTDTISFNESQLNDTIDDRAITTETDPIWTANSSLVAYIGRTNTWTAGNTFNDIIYIGDQFGGAIPRTIHPDSFGDMSINASDDLRLIADDLFLDSDTVHVSDGSTSVATLRFDTSSGSANLIYRGASTLFDMPGSVRLILGEKLILSPTSSSVDSINLSVQNNDELLVEALNTNTTGSLTVGGDIRANCIESEYEIMMSDNSAPPIGGYWTLHGGIDFGNDYGRVITMNSTIKEWWVGTRTSTLPQNMTIQLRLNAAALSNYTTDAYGEFGGGGWKTVADGLPFDVDAGNELSIYHILTSGSNLDDPVAVVRLKRRCP